MGNEHRELLNAIECEFIQLVYRWQLFCQLFDSGQENIDLLNNSGSNVFQLLQKLIIDDVMMALCRLLDPDRSMGHENASIRNLLKKVKGRLSEETSMEVDAKLSELYEHMKKISTLKNKALSHSDFEHVLNAEPLPRPTYGELEKSIDAICSILNTLTGELHDYSASLVPKMPCGHDGNKLLSVLAKAHESKQKAS